MLLGGGIVKHILVIEDDPDIQKLIRELLTVHSFRVDVVGTGTEGILLFQKIHMTLFYSMLCYLI